MQKAAGLICTIGGLIAFVYTLISFFNNSKSFSALGVDVVITEGNITPVIISAVILLAGIILLTTSKGRSGKG